MDKQTKAILKTIIATIAVLWIIAVLWVLTNAIMFVNAKAVWQSADYVIILIGMGVVAKILKGIINEI